MRIDERLPSLLIEHFDTLQTHLLLTPEPLCLLSLLMHFHGNAGINTCARNLLQQWSPLISTCLQKCCKAPLGQEHRARKLLITQTCQGDTFALHRTQSRSNDFPGRHIAKLMTRSLQSTIRLVVSPVLRPVTTKPAVLGGKHHLGKACALMTRHNLIGTTRNGAQPWGLTV